MTRLHLLTGFLGSGKTSVINSLLGHLRSKRVGLIVNDFGPIVVDSALVSQGSAVVATKSLSGGQIFCSCLSGSFIESVEAMLAHEPDLILVETSGLAKPAPLLEIVSIIQKRGADKVSYGGMVCVVDAERYHLLSQAIKTMEEQLVFSDAFILNKVDLVDEATRTLVTEEITALRPLAPLYATTFGEVSAEMLSLWTQPVALAHPHAIDAATYAGWGVHGRPKTLVCRLDGSYAQDELERLMLAVSAQMLRIKGFLSVKDGWGYQVDAVGPHVQVTRCEMPASIPTGIVCIHAANLDAPALLIREWEQVGNTGCRLEIVS